MSSVALNVAGTRSVRRRTLNGTICTSTGEGRGGRKRDPTTERHALFVGLTFVHSYKVVLYGGWYSSLLPQKRADGDFLKTVTVNGWCVRPVSGKELLANDDVYCANNIYLDIAFCQYEEGCR